MFFEELSYSTSTQEAFTILFGFDHWKNIFLLKNIFQWEMLA